MTMGKPAATSWTSRVRCRGHALRQQKPENGVGRVGPALIGERAGLRAARPCVAKTIDHEHGHVTASRRAWRAIARLRYRQSADVASLLRARIVLARAR